MLQVSSVVRYGRAYELEDHKGNKIQTNRCLLVYVEDREKGRPIRLMAISNQRVSEREFSDYMAQISRAGKLPPTPAWLKRKAESVQKLLSAHTYTAVRHSRAPPAVTATARCTDMRRV